MDLSPLTEQVRPGGRFHRMQLLKNQNPGLLITDMACALITAGTAGGYWQRICTVGIDLKHDLTFKKLKIRLSGAVGVTLLRYEEV